MGWTEPEPGTSAEDIDPNDPIAFEAWCEELECNAEVRVSGARERLFRLGVIDGAGKLVSEDLPIDMLPGSEADVGTG